MLHINEFPVEIFLNILNETNGITIGKCRRVCRQWKKNIDNNDFIWHAACQNEFKISSNIARKKADKKCSWYDIFKNLKKWEDIEQIEIKVKEFFKFTTYSSNHVLDIDYGVLPLKDSNGVVLYDMNNLKNIPVVVPNKSCYKISNNDYATVLLIKTKLFLQINNPSQCKDAVYDAEGYILTENLLHFYNKTDVFECRLNTDRLTPKLLIQCEFKIKEMQYNNKLLYIFTNCGKIITLNGNKILNSKPINIPYEWIKQIKHICAYDDRNFLSYSRHLLNIETDKYQHLYLDFPLISSLFFYGEFVLLATENSEILLYRFSKQQKNTKPIFQRLALLPDGKYAIKLDVCERISGPIIVMSTFVEIYIMEINFFSHDHEKINKNIFPEHKLNMYKRLLKLKERLKVSF